MNTYKELLQNAKYKLKQQGIADADIDAWYLLSHVFHINRTDLFLYGDNPVPEDLNTKYQELINQRVAHIPLQYITGMQEFMGLEFNVSEDVLIPRQDTEILALEVLRFCDGKTVLDMCTGSGCIIISVAKLGRPIKAVGSDISIKALEVANSNAVKHKVEVEFLQSDLFNQISGSFDIIVSNPPYIPTDEIMELMPEVKDHEPISALDGSSDGLYFYRRISKEAIKHLHRGGVILFEIGYNQGDDVKQILLNEGFTDVVIKKDLSGLDRVVTAIRL